MEDKPQCQNGSSDNCCYVPLSILACTLYLNKPCTPVFCCVQLAFSIHAINYYLFSINYLHLQLHLLEDTVSTSHIA